MGRGLEGDLGLIRLATIGVVLAAVLGHEPVLAQASDEARAILELEAERQRAIQAGDGAALGRLLTADYVEVDVDGRLRGRSEAIKAIAPSAPRAPSASAGPPADENQRVHLHGAAAILVGAEAGARVLRVWVRPQSRWQLAAAQAARIDPGAPGVKPSPEQLASPRIQRATHNPAAKAVLAAQQALDRANAVHDANAFASLTAEDFVLVTSHGLVRGKEDRIVEQRWQRLQQLTSEAPSPLPELDDIHLQLYGTTAVLTARSWGVNANGAPRMPARFTRVWQQAASGWQQIASIATLATIP